MDVVNLKEKLSHFTEHWSPKIVGEVNDCYIKLVKFQGPFMWHHHDNEDELFFVVKGSFRMRLKDGDRTVREGELIIIPRGVEHMPVAEQECHVMLIEPRSTLNTGNLKNERTVEELERI